MPDEANRSETPRWEMSGSTMVAFLGLLAGAIVQFGGGIWMISGMNTRLDRIDTQTITHQRLIDQSAAQQTTMAVQLGRIEERLATLIRRDMERQGGR